MSQTIRRLVLVKQLGQGFSFGPHVRFLRFFLCTPGLLPSEKLVFLTNKRINAVGSLLESIPINFSNAKSGYATVFAIFFLGSLVAPILFNFVLFAQQISIQVALT